MLKKIISLTVSFIVIVTGLILTDNVIPSLSEYLGYDLHGNGIFGISFAYIGLGLLGVGLFAWLALVLEPFITNSICNASERWTTSLSRIPTSDILVIVFGVGIGLILANLIGAPFARLPLVGPYVPIVLSLIMAIVGAKLALRKHNDIVGFFNRIPSRKAVKVPTETTDVKAGPLGDRLYSSNKLLDTSVIIDGRIMDILSTGFMDGRMVVPNFVLEELQKLSDSSDNMKRAKGRRGLDMVHDMQLSYKDQVLIVDNDYDDINEVDAKLVRLAKQSGATIITNDFNLNKVAEIQGIKVLNINELANAIKTVVVAGEEMNVFLVKEGKEQGQAVAYLDDGTMIVVENGRRSLGSSIPVVVSSVLQTAAGRMIFARAKE